VVDTFIRRPILASVCSLVIILAGAIAIPTLPIAQFPELTPPTVSVGAFYQGASAEIVESAVTQPIEQALNGVEGMQYITSSSSSNGSASITVTFDVNRDIDVAAVDVQNRITAGEVVNALREQNVQVAAGQVGAQPARPGQQYQISVRAVGRLTEPAEFDDLILKRTPDGTVVRLKDIGRTELGAEDYSTALRYKGVDGVGLGVRQLPTANSLQVYRDVSAAIGRLSKQFPPGLKVEMAFDTTRVVSESIREVVTTLLEAIALVIVVMFLFLQNWKTTLIPAITIPVSLIGTFMFVKLFGFSINTLTLFGITLATGLVVDDAIVVIENIERHLQEGAADPGAAASQAMREVAGAVIATSLVLVA